MAACGVCDLQGAHRLVAGDHLPAEVVDDHISNIIIQKYVLVCILYGGDVGLTECSIYESQYQTCLTNSYNKRLD